ncbi:hypothetical protein [Anaerorhabdus sp.]|uniref:hypothetical protein n=1 Tax=Anaerorhabdus sp. TaxID=1872524 RepID=UPI002FC5A20E
MLFGIFGLLLLLICFIVVLPLFIASFAFFIPLLVIGIVIWIIITALKFVFFLF